MSKLRDDENARLGVRLLVLKHNLAGDTPEAMKEFFGADISSEKDFSKCWSKTINKMPKEHLEFYMRKYHVDELMEELEADRRREKVLEPIRKAFYETISDGFGKWWADDFSKDFQCNSLSELLDEYYVLRKEYDHLIDEWVSWTEGAYVDKTCRKFGFSYKEVPETMKPLAALILEVVREELYSRASVMQQVETDDLYYEAHKDEER